MGINTGGQPLGPEFRKQRITRNPYRGFRNPPPFNPLKGHHEPLLPEEGTTRVALLELVEVGYDYLICRGHDPNTGDFMDSVAVAKPYPLQRTPFDGVTLNVGGLSVTYTYASQVDRRTASSPGEESEVHLVTPDYIVGEIITAIRAEVAGGDNTGLADVDGNEIEWVEIGGGRVWAVEVQ